MYQTYCNPPRKHRPRIVRALAVLCALALCLGLLMQLFPLTDRGKSASARVPQDPQPLPSASWGMGAEASEGAAQAVVLYDVGADQILFAENPTGRVEPASLTKLLTALTAWENGGASISYPVSDEIDQIGPNSSIAYLRKGDVLSFEAIVDAVLLSSGNDATYTLAVNVARHSAGRELSIGDALAHFAGLMNATAAGLGCTDSRFVTVDGYPDPQHYTTAYDMLRIAIAAGENPALQKSVGRRRAYHVFLSGRDVVWETTNQLLQPDSPYAYPYATGMKTGSASASSFSLAASAEKDGQRLIALVIGADSDHSRFAQAVSLLDQGFGR